MNLRTRIMGYLRGSWEKWLLLCVLLRQLAGKYPLTFRLGDLLLGVGRAVVATVLLLAQVFTYVVTPVTRGLVRAMRNNLLPTCIIFIGIASISALLITPVPAPAVLHEPTQEERPAYSIGAVLSLTGKHERRGNEMRRGYELALHAYNDSGGVRIDNVPHNLALIIYDDESSPVRAAEVTELMFTFDNPNLLLAPYSSSLARPVIHIAQQHKTPVVVPVASSAGMGDMSLEGVFLLQTPPLRHLREAAELFISHANDTAAAVTDGKKKKKGKQAGPFANGATPRVALVATRDPHAHAVMEEVATLLHNEGIADVVTIDVNAPDEQFTEAAKELEKVDGLFIAAYAPGALRILGMIGSNGYNVPFVAMTHCSVAQVSRKEPTAAEGALCALHWQPEAKFVGTAPLDDDFVATYYKRYGSTPSHQSAAAAAAIQVIASALRRAAITKAPLAQELARTNLNTFYGPIKFGSDGFNVAKPMVLSQVVQSRYVPVAPRKVALQQVNFLRPRLVRVKK